MQKRRQGIFPCLLDLLYTRQSKADRHPVSNTISNTISFFSPGSYPMGLRQDLPGLQGRPVPAVQITRSAGWMPREFRFLFLRCLVRKGLLIPCSLHSLRNLRCPRGFLRPGGSRYLPRACNQLLQSSRHRLV